MLGKFKEGEFFMVSRVVFEIKGNVRSWSNQCINFDSVKIGHVKIDIENTSCSIIIDGNNEKCNHEYIVLIWELLVWQDGYFYKPIAYFVNDEARDISLLLTVKYKVTDKKWIDSAILLCRNHRQIDETVIEKYRGMRNLDRKDQSMNKSMFSSFFYLISESYAEINLEHRLVLLMHICDGLAIEYLNGSNRNNPGNINIILNRLDVARYKQGAVMLGLDSSKAKNALGATRNELTHYIYMNDSLGACISNPSTETDNMVNLYAFYVLEVACRIAVLEILGITISDDIKGYVMDEHLDWIRLEKHLNEDCVLPENYLRQVIERLKSSEPKEGN
jgi:hypothetical protein